MRIVICFIGLVTLFLTAAIATPTTHIWGPSTDIQPFGKLHITDDVYLPTEPGPAPVTNIGLTYGVLKSKRVNLELGLDHKAGLGNLDRYPLYFNAKLGIPEGACKSYLPAAAIGIYDLGTRSFDETSGLGTNFNILYGKLAKSINKAGRFSAGWFVGNKNLLRDSHGEQDNSGLLVAWERTLSEWSDKAWVCLEYMGTESGYGTMNLGASWKFSDTVAVLAGYDFFNNKDGVDTATLQVDIDLDIVKSK